VTGIAPSAHNTTNANTFGMRQIVAGQPIERVMEPLLSDSSFAKDCRIVRPGLSAIRGRTSLEAVVAKICGEIGEDGRRGAADDTARSMVHVVGVAIGPLGNA
jgi:hypothetical protein